MLHERNTDEEDFMQEAESAVSSTLEPCSIRYCIALMKELKMELQKTAFAQISDCVLALSIPEIITQKNVRTAMEKAGFHVIRVMTATDACALSKAQDMKHDQQFGVRVISNCKKQNLLAEFSAWTDQTNMLEGLEYTIGENTPEMIPNMTYYYLMIRNREKHWVRKQSDTRIFPLWPRIELQPREPDLPILPRSLLPCLYFSHGPPELKFQPSNGERNAFH